jgi:hypothetical protein
MRPVLFVLFVLSIIFCANAQKISKTDNLEIANKIDDWNNGWKVKDCKRSTNWYGAAAELRTVYV